MWLACQGMISWRSGLDRARVTLPAAVRRGFDLRRYGIQGGVFYGSYIVNRTCDNLE